MGFAQPHPIPKALVAAEREVARAQAAAVQQRTAELDVTRLSVLKLTRQLDEEAVEHRLFEHPGANVA